jgi:hypothetical protein
VRPPATIAKLVQITPITMVYCTQITIVTWAYKPTDIAGGLHIVVMLTNLVKNCGHLS